MISPLTTLPLRPTAGRCVALALVAAVLCLAGPGCATRQRTSRYASGEVMETYSYYVDDDGMEIKHGPYRRWDERGNPKLQCNYEDGVLHGVYRVWPNTGPSRIYRFDNGKRVENAR